jgi:two-component system phosphate regulon sensor histidine kinase PhoR
MVGVRMLNQTMRVRVAAGLSVLAAGSAIAVALGAMAPWWAAGISVGALVWAGIWAFGPDVAGQEEVSASALSARDRLLRIAGESDEASSGAKTSDRGAELAQSLRLAAERAEAVSSRFGIERRMLQSVIDAVDAAVVATEPGGAVILCNRAAEVLFQGRLGTPMGRFVDELFTQHEVIGMHAAAAGGTTQRSQVRMAVRGEMRTIEAMAVPLPGEIVPASSGVWSVTGESGSRSVRQGAVLILRDVTDMAEAVRLKTDFVANASHEFRTPLSSIRAAVETIADSARDDPAMMDRLLSMIASNVGRLEELTRDLLELSRLESAEAPVDIGPVSLLQLADSLEEEFTTVCAERKLRLVFEIEDGFERVESDAKLLRLILRNLIDNATKFANPQTDITVQARVISPTQGGPNTKRHAARFRVIDRGMGIPLQAQRRIFERFYQVDPSRSGQAARRGSGLGLAIVKHSVRALGGTIGVESVWKQGTTMIVDLPACVAIEGDSPA